MEIIERYNFINDLFQSKLKVIDSLIEDTPYPKSLLSLYSKVLQIESIKKNLDLSDNNFYSSQILLRSLLEHYLVGYYIYYKTNVEGNDLIGEIFYNDYVKSEIIKRENYTLALDKARGKTECDNIDDCLSKYGDSFKDLNQAKINDIHKNASQFNNVRTIIKYLLNIKDTSNENQHLHNLLFAFIEKYNILSSYVHGGVSAEVESFNKEDEHLRQKTIIENKEWGISLESSIKFYFLFLLHKNDPNEIIKLAGFLKK